jgi:hypothetical protein
MSENNISLTQHKDLIQQHESLVQQVKNMQTDATVAREELEAMNAQIANVQPSERMKLIRQRGALVDQSDALGEALKILVHRRDAARLAIFEYLELTAENEAKKLHAISKNLSIQLDQALKALRHLNLTPRSGNETEAERDVTRTNLEVSIAKIKTETHIAFRDSNRAGYALERSRNETRGIREELGISE